MQNLLIRRRVHLDGIYYCPYHPEGVIAKYRRESEFRKPGSGMLAQAAEDLDIDLEQSWMIGNSYSDITAGANAGCRTILISSSAKLPRRSRGEARPDKTAANIKEAANIIKMFQRENLVAAARKTEVAESVAETEYEAPAQSFVEAPAEAEPHTEAADESQAEDTAEASRTSAPIEDETAAEVKTQTRKDRSTEMTPAKATSRAVAKTADDGRRLMKPESGRRADDAEEPSGEGDSDSPDTRVVMQEVMRYLKKIDRMNMYDEFSLMKMLTGVIQVVIVFLLLLSLWFLIDHERDATTVHTVLGYAGVLQLMVIAFHLMRDRK